ncbi:MAG: hypothetical protein KFB93_05280 [Simkaniaceae bacterium]|nr:MAG: hypothetical protein KFB93_05280 [Simkaniaceae bacterium]
MTKVNQSPKAPHLQQIQAIQTRDPAPFKTFLAGFSPDERKQFLKNMTRHFGHIITRHMRKMKEANERMKESIQPR